MRKVIGQPVMSQDGKFRVTGFDDKSVRIDRLCTGKIISINEASPQENENGTIFYVATVEADLNGNKHVGSAIIWHNQLKSPKLPEGTFGPGATVGLAIQVKSKYAGNTSIELAGGVKLPAAAAEEGLDDAWMAEQLKAMGLEGINISA